MSSVSITLEYPINVGGKAYASLTMRRPKLRDEMVVDKLRHTDPGSAELQLFCNLCEVSQDVMVELDMADYGRLQNAYTGFTKPAAETPSS